MLGTVFDDLVLLLCRLAGTKTEEVEKSFTNFVLVAENNDINLQVKTSIKEL